MKQALVSEVEPPAIHGDSKHVKVFTLSLNGVTVELCSIGASISKILLPKSNGSGTDDVVLGYKSPLEMYESGNTPYFGVIVGRVANRIAKGQFKLDGREYTLAVNNDPNHLHGGIQGFSSRVWDMEIVDVPMEGGISIKGVKCSLISLDGDQGYPGTILLSAVYTLEANKSGNGVSLRLDMKAQLKNDIPSPINLAQHTYFNLGKHNDPNGVLDHKLSLACESYTPNDATSIPTRQVTEVKDDPAMDLSSGKAMRDSLNVFAVAKAGLCEEEAMKHTMPSPRTGSSIAKAGLNCPTPGEPYGFDHNFLVPPALDASGLSLVGTVEHEESKRRLKVYTNAPGVQVYTANFLDGVNPDPNICKEGAVYGQWQGFCLETQNFPDSILSPEDETKFPDFAKGKCHILRPGGPDYGHTVAYSFENLHEK